MPPRRPNRRGPLDCDELELGAHRLEQLRRHIVMVGDDLAVAHDDDERLQDLPELLAHVRLEVEDGVGGERGAEVGGDERGEASRRARGHRAGDAVGHPEEHAAFGRQHQRQEREQAERDPPVQAAIPARIHVVRTLTSAAL